MLTYVILFRVLRDCFLACVVPSVAQSQCVVYVVKGVREREEGMVLLPYKPRSPFSF